ncbi:hypothetical protein [Pseudomonas sp. BMS12]|uniref:hypothetical protein n=1 Tax=Pseudomonas sp. BMS12 TaxID=1796033 RepID=UPI000A6E2D74|nr:hypothetical protein [Pseudomonas sp. BMS12]
MKRIINAAVIATISTLLLSGCGDSDSQQKTESQAEHSKKILDMGDEPDRSKDKGF